MREFDIVCGFFGSGKTSLVNEILSKKLTYGYERILYIQTERGKVDLDRDLDDLSIRKIVVSKEEDFTEDLLNGEISSYRPEYIILELNGFWDISRPLSFKMEDGFIISRIFALLDHTTLDSYINNMGQVIIGKISNADYVIFNRVIKKKIKPGRALVKSLNPHAQTYFEPSYDTDLRGDFTHSPDKNNNRKQGYDLDRIFSRDLSPSDKSLLVPLSIFVLGISFFYCLKLLFDLVLSGEVLLDKFTRLSMVFTGILLQAIPFILIGALFSALIQVLLDREKFLGIFGQKSFTSILFAAFAGFCFPVCDCGLAPLVNGFVKRRGSIASILTFFIAAPSVNPIVILSTYYAFSQNLSVLVLRVILGIFISIVVGRVLLALERKNIISPERIIKEGSFYSYFDEEIIFDRSLGKLELIFKHIKREFFNMFKYLVFGALLAACYQVFLPRSIIFGLADNKFLATGVLLVSSVLISVCANSNAFIARVFAGTFPLSSLMAFIVVGPMVDITNILMLSASFKKRFLFVWLLGILVFSWIFFSILP